MLRRPLIYLVPVLLFLGSCKVFFPNTMFKAGKHYAYARPDSTQYEHEYLLRAGDQMEVRVYSNNGYELVDVLQSVVARANPITYTISPNGKVPLPLIDSVEVAGSTIRAIKANLSKLYSYYFVHPFIIINVLNRRASVYLGSDQAVMVPLTSEDMSVVEVLATAGGVKGGLRADRIKLIRGDLKAPKVYLLDLSTIDGLVQAGKLNVEPNDILYVEPSENVVAYLGKISQALGAVASIIGFYTLVASFTKK